MLRQHIQMKMLINDSNEALKPMEDILSKTFLWQLGKLFKTLQNIILQ